MTAIQHQPGPKPYGEDQVCVRCGILLANKNDDELTSPFVYFVLKLCRNHPEGCKETSFEIQPTAPNFFGLCVS